MSSIIHTGSIAVGLALGALVSIVPMAAGSPDAGGKLIGTWETATGTQFLHLLPGGKAMLDVGDPNQNQVVEVHFGTYRPVGKGMWELTARGLDNREHTFNIIFNKANSLSIADSSGALTTFHRVAIRFDNLDTNHDGVVTDDELKITRLAKLFKEFDANRDDKVTREEFRAYWARVSR